MSINALSVITGNVSTQSAGRIRTDGNDRPVLGGTITNGRLHTLYLPIFNCGIWVTSSTGSQLQEDFLFETDQLPGAGIGFHPPPAQPPDILYLSIPRRYIHNEATLATFGIKFSITKNEVPIHWPRIQIDGRLVDNTQNGIANLNNSVIIAWSSGFAYSTGMYISPGSAGTNNGYYFRVTSPGTSAGPEPTWPSTPGAFVTDGGGVVYECVGRSGEYPSMGATSDSYYSGGVAGPGQILYFDTDPSVANTVFADNQYAIYMLAAGLDPNMIITGILLEYNLITKLGLE